MDSGAAPATVRSTLKHEELTQRVIGVFYEVYNELGFGFLESVYEKAMLVALGEANLKAENQFPTPVWFRGRQVGEFFADILVENVLVIELKTAKNIDNAHQAQLLHYLKATDFEIGLLFNFGPKPEFKRLILDNAEKKSRRNFSYKNPCESVKIRG